jgi:two-component system response regulator DevR
MTMGAGGGENRAMRVFLLDDHEMIRRGMRELFEHEPEFEVVGEAATAEQAKARIPALRPDVAVLDVRLPDGSGIDVCRHVKDLTPGLQVVMLTSFNDEDALFASIMAGAAGYVLKDVDGDSLLNALRKVASGQSLLDPAVTTRVLERIRNGERGDKRLAGLTDQERRVLTLIGEGLTNRQIAAEMFLSEKTVKNYVTSLMRKLGLERRTQVAILATKIES